MAQPRKYKTVAERQFAYRLRHHKAKLVRLSVIDDLRQEIIRRKAKITIGAAKPADTLLRVLEVLSFVERELGALRPVAKAQGPV
jgi:hypothetical protein